MQEQIERIHPDQADVLRDLRLRGLEEAPEAFGPRYTDIAARPKEYWHQHVLHYASSQDSATFLLYRNGKPVGMAGAYLEGSRRDHAYICNMWVDPTYRRGGAGGRLVDTATRWLAEQGVERINAWVVETNTTALRFYETLGFVRDKNRRQMPSSPEAQEILLVFDTALL
ncbi:GNAT family N-acetyltransferase [Chitinimonas sp. BJB300]|uniref:GNAT family N-acetyltransferase n=1 Tax=Chitinimonas sp. BJB300 TaxID=1559339 RepID=UPI000C11550D|nr:GNAT family N-acetyltransferase [Chitinimonas sp. BJB300]PHV13217.1 GNAT family N-acetyltransferase [Chitinimonas sp. BJB300]TSJ89610.1 GNAT family N-acetyltransferase [Chitinimonas sp. BJB300]